MRNIALMPEGDVFKGGLRVAAEDAGETADLLAGDGVLLVGHGRGALLLFAEVLLGLADFGALQVANFDGELVECAGDEGECRDIRRVAVALDDLRGYRRGFEAETLADPLFVLRLQMTKRADGAGEFADAHVFGGGGEASCVALHLRVPVE